MKTQLKEKLASMIMQELLNPNSTIPLSWITEAMDLFQICDTLTEEEATFYMKGLLIL